MTRIIVLLALFISSVLSVYASSDINAQTGVVDTSQTKQVCLSIQNADLKKGDQIFIVLPEKPQSVKTATIENKLMSSCSRNTETEENVSFYSLKLSKGKFDQPIVGFGMLNSKISAPVKGVVSVDLNKDQKKEYFRVCSSTEGLHLTIWTGKPLIGKRIWHSYYYLGYDVVPDCKKADYKE